MFAVLSILLCDLFLFWKSPPPPPTIPEFLGEESATAGLEGAAGTSRSDAGGGDGERELEASSKSTACMLPESRYDAASSSLERSLSSW